MPEPYAPKTSYNRKDNYYMIAASSASLYPRLRAETKSPLKEQVLERALLAMGSSGGIHLMRALLSPTQMNDADAKVVRLAQAKGRTLTVAWGQLSPGPYKMTVLVDVMGSRRLISLALQAPLRSAQMAECTRPELRLLGGVKTAVMSAPLPQVVMTSADSTQGTTRLTN